MAQIFDHRPKTRGAGPGMGTLGAVGVGLSAARGIEQEEQSLAANKAEAKRRETEFQHKQSLYGEEAEIMQLRLQEAKRVSEEGAAVRGFGREAVSVEFFTADGRMNPEIASQLTPEQQASAERWNQDPNIPAEFLNDKLEEWQNEAELKDLMGQWEEFARRAESISGTGAAEGSGGRGPLSDGIEELVLQAKQDPSRENLAKLTLELHEMERQALVEQRAQRGWERAQARQDELISADGATLPKPDDDNYEDYVDLMTDIDSSVTTIKHPVTGEIIPKDYDALIDRLSYYLNPNIAEAAKTNIANRVKRQVEMRESNPEVYARLAQQYGNGEVPMRAFARAAQDHELRAGVGDSLVGRARAGMGDPGQDPLAAGPSAVGGPAGLQGALQDRSGGGTLEQPAAGGGAPPSPAVQGAPTDSAATLQGIREGIESGELPPLSETRKLPDSVLDELIQMGEGGASRSDLAAKLAVNGAEPDSVAVAEQLEKRRAHHEKAAKKEADKAAGQEKHRASQRKRDWSKLSAMVHRVQPGKTGWAGRRFLSRQVQKRAKELGIPLSKEGYERLLRDAGLDPKDPVLRFHYERPAPDPERARDHKDG